MRSRTLATAVLSLGLLAGVGIAPEAAAAKVCVPLRTGTQCVEFLEGRPSEPGLSKGMAISVSPRELTSAGTLTVKITGFRPREGLRRFNFNIFGQNRMVEYSSDFRRADSKGAFSWKVAPSTAIYESTWGEPALCVLGQRSRKLACASFSVAPEATDTSVPESSPDVGAPESTPTTSPPTAGGNCRDYGFTVMCTE